MVARKHIRRFEQSAACSLKEWSSQRIAPLPTNRSIDNTQQKSLLHTAPNFCNHFLHGMVAAPHTFGSRQGIRLSRLFLKEALTKEILWQIPFSLSPWWIVQVLFEQTYRI